MTKMARSASAIGHQRAGIGVRGCWSNWASIPAGAGWTVLHGGPVEPGRGFVLHSDDWGGQDTIQVVGLGALTGTIDVLKAIAEGRGRAAI
jgi:putative transcriptional regulator